MDTILTNYDILSVVLELFAQAVVFYIPLLGVFAGFNFVFSLFTSILFSKGGKFL